MDADKILNGLFAALVALVVVMLVIAVVALAVKYPPTIGIFAAVAVLAVLIYRKMGEM